METDIEQERSSPGSIRGGRRRSRTMMIEAERGETMVSAYILIQTEVGKATHVTKTVDAIEGVVQVDGVTGPYDVIARAEAADLDQLAKSIVMKLQEVEGVTRTLTCPVLQL